MLFDAAMLGMSGVELIVAGVSFGCNHGRVGGWLLVLALLTIALLILR